MSSIAEAVESGGLPGRVWLYSNYHCNLDCNYCLTESAPGVAKRQLTHEQMVSAASQARDLGFTDLGVTGGEPFLALGMADTLAAMAEHLPVVANTNGTLFTGKRLAALDAISGADVKLQISLDSAEPDANDAARGPGNFAAVVEAIPRLVSSGIRVRIATTVADVDDHDLARLCDMHRSWGVPEDDHVVRPIVHRGRAIDGDQGIETAAGDLPAELTITAHGAYWSSFGPTVHNGVPDTDLLLTRTTDPLSIPAEVLLRLFQDRSLTDPGDSTGPGKAMPIRCA
jgi:MoaA/NifB/PqqE/SkfB family radical SAM enzyme